MCLIHRRNVSDYDHGIFELWYDTFNKQLGKLVCNLISVFIRACKEQILRCVKAEYTAKGRAVARIAGFHSQNHAIANTYAGGNISASIPVMAIGGLIGNNGNATNTSGEGCVINCNITGGTEANAGFIVGYWNGTDKNVTLGSAESPIEVSGTLNGAAPSAANVCGTANAAGAHVLNYVIK